MAPAIYFHPDAVETEGKELVGRRSAGQSFLKGYLRHVPGPAVNVVTSGQDGRAAFEAAARALGEQRPIEAEVLRGDGDFARFGTVFFPAPGYMNAPWLRLRRGAASCSLVGITHTVSTRRVIEGLHDLLASPVEPWDALICTSRAVRAVLETQFEREAAYFAERFGATRVPLPQLPVIPLGIHAADFAPSAAMRAEARARYAAPEEAVVFLSVGRWTSIEKANPVPMFQALESVAADLGLPVHLWLVGWAAREAEEALHKAGAAALCPSVTVRMIDGRDGWVRRAIWSGADIFTLAVDNVQETFGLAPVEAMAAGLPVVVPDWDGLRDTVVQGQTGFLIPTRMAQPGRGARLAARFADGTDDYVRYLGMVSQHVQVDVPAYREALGALARDPALRARMGRAGRARVAERFDWAAVIPQYLALAEELAGRRAAAQVQVQEPVNPVEIDPFMLYAAYPTAVLTPDTEVRPVRPLTAEALAALDALNGRTLYRRRIVPDAMLLACMAALSDGGPMTVAALAERIAAPVALAEAMVLFLAKYDFAALPPLTPR